MHIRQLIREAFVAALLSETVAGSKVYSSRSRSFFNSELPALNVKTPEEKNERIGVAPVEDRRTMKVIVEGKIQALEDFDKDVDDLAEEIEKAIRIDFYFTTPKFGIDGVEKCRLTRTVSDFSAEGETHTGTLEMTYEVDYITYEPDEGDITLVNFNTAVTNYQNIEKTKILAKDFVTDLNP